MKKASSSLFGSQVGTVLLLCLLLLQASSGQTPTAQTAPANLSARIEKFVAPYLQMRDFSGSVLISQNGRTLFAKGFGSADFELSTPNTPSTRFRIGSLNKQLTAAGILLLEEQGNLSTDDPVSKFFPDFPGGDRIKLRHLLTHRSGLPKYVPYPAGKKLPSSAELVRIISALPPEAKPGERYNYSNAGFVLLALIVEKVSGKTFPRFLRENVFQPLGMKQSGVGLDKTLAKGYVTGVGTEILPAPNLNVFNYEVYSSVEDLDKWQRGLYGGKLLSQTSLNKMTTDYGDRYGYGLSVGMRPRRYFGHDGVISGYNGFVAYFPDEKLSVTFLGNIESGALGVMQVNLPSIAFGNEPETAQPRVFGQNVKTEKFGSYVGRYEVFPGFYLDVKLENNRLALRGPLGAFVALTPLSENEFFYRHLYAKVVFVGGESGQVVRLDWNDANGGTYPCKKISSTY